MLERISKILSSCGIASRREADKMIKTGRVLINGKLPTLGQKADIMHDDIMVDGRSITNSGFVYLALHKPRGYLSATKDNRNRKCVTDLIKDINLKLFPVGRLDYNSEGLIFMTNDGFFAQKLTKPSSEIEKTYRVTINSKVFAEVMVAFSEGIDLGDFVTKPAKIKILSEEENRSVVEIIITEGKNRQIRRCFEKFGIKVIRLKRIKIGTVKLAMLKLGDYRYLKEEEVSSLLALCK